MDSDLMAVQGEAQRQGSRKPGGGHLRPLDHGLAFAGRAVRAILDGTKTVDRRPISPRNAYFSSAEDLFWKHANFAAAWVDGRGARAAGLDCSGCEEYLHVPCHRGSAEQLDRLDEIWKARGQEHRYRDSFPDCSPCAVCDSMGWPMTSHRLWSRIKPGSRLWVKEEFWPAFRPANGNNGCVYRADYLRPTTLDPGVYFQKTWTPAGRMTRFASRLKLDVLSVRAERLQDITDEEAELEGVPTFAEMFPSFSPEQRLTTGELVSDQPHRAGFAVLWDELNGKRSWRSNPLVWRYEFRPLEKAP